MNETILEHLLFGTLLLAPVVLLVRQWYLNKAPTYAASVVVESRQVVVGRYHGRGSSGWNHLVTFRLSDGDTITLFTTEAEYFQLKEDMHAAIVWQNDTLCQWELQE